MVILHTEDLKNWGGQQNRVLTECIGLDKRGHKMIIACHKGSMLAQKSKMAGIKTYELNMVKQAHLLTIPKLIRIIKEEKVDIVATHSSVDSWAGGIAAKLAGRKLIRFRHNLYRIGRDPLARVIYALPDRFITVNYTAAQVLIETGFIKPNKVKRVYGAVDCERFNPAMVTDEEKKRLKQSFDIPEDALIIGNTSGFTEVKGQRYLLEAADKLLREKVNIFLLLVGRLGQKDKVLKMVNPQFHDRIKLPGLRADIPSLLSIMDIFVFPSTIEAFGNSLIEAMAMSLPVVVSDIPSFREFMADGQDGIFFKKADSDSLFNALMQLIYDPKTCAALGDHARKTVSKKFLYERMIDETESIYLNLMDIR